MMDQNCDALIGTALCGRRTQFIMLGYRAVDNAPQKMPSEWHQDVLMIFMVRAFHSA
jgi:hypothetical protein